jgi:uncharacterized membrane protein
MTLFVNKIIQRVRLSLIIVGGLMFLVIPFLLILSGATLVLIFVGLGCLMIEIARRKILGIRMKLSHARRGGSLW